MAMKVVSPVLIFKESEIHLGEGLELLGVSTTLYA